MKALVYYLDAPQCFQTDKCVICNVDKPKSYVICDKCNNRGFIEIGIHLRKKIKQ